MGRIRKFTQEAYDALQSGVSDDGEILDFFSDIPLNISNFFNSLELEDDLSNFQSYLRDISDFENYEVRNRTIYSYTCNNIDIHIRNKKIYKKRRTARQDNSKYRIRNLYCNNSGILFKSICNVHNTINKTVDKLKNYKINI